MRGTGEGRGIPLSIVDFTTSLFSIYIICNIYAVLTGVVPQLFIADVMHLLGFSEEEGASFISIIGVFAIVGCILYALIRGYLR